MTTIITDPLTFRSNIRTKLKDKLKTENETLVSNIEKSIFNYAIKECRNKKIICKWDKSSFVTIYIDKLRTVIANLNCNDILEMLQNGKLEPSEYVFMSHQEINPKRWEEAIKIKTIKDDNKFNEKLEASTDLFTCPRSTCKSKKCTFYELQTRSADEPMTIFVTCLDCGKNFKKS
jgi:DNA-directed RNA polymerase subunit M/transcription elongation factor TFIIS